MLAERSRPISLIDKLAIDCLQSDTYITELNLANYDIFITEIEALAKGNLVNFIERYLSDKYISYGNAKILAKNLS